jgi:hypothetical protein
MKKLYMIISAAALFALALGIYSLIDDLNFRSRAILTEGKVIEIKISSSSQHGNRNNGDGFNKTPIVSYITQEGEKFTSKIDRIYGHMPEVGETVKIYYDSAYHGNARMGKGIGKSVLATTFGAVSCLTLIFFFVRSVIKGRARKKLTQTGIRIAADIVSVGNNETPVVMSKHPYIIKCQWLQNSSNTIFHFKSKYIYYNPSKYVGDRKQIDIFIDPEDPKKYFMDLSFIPKKG